MINRHHTFKFFGPKKFTENKLLFSQSIEFEAHVIVYGHFANEFVKLLNPNLLYDKIIAKQLKYLKLV